MENERRKELKEQYMNRRPDMGIMCWKSGDTQWVAPTRDAHADYNSSLFQLKLGSFPNREMQKRYAADPESFTWELISVLDYQEPDEDHTDDLRLLMMDVKEKYPDILPLKPNVKIE